MMTSLAKKGAFGLVDIILAMLLLAVIFVIGTESVILIRPMLKIAKDRNLALNLSMSQIEDLKIRAGDIDVYDAAAGPLTAGNNKPTTLNASDLPAGFTLTYNVEDRDEWAGGTGPEYKIITAQCRYRPVLAEVVIRAYIPRP